jgi:hypothetical protein
MRAVSATQASPRADPHHIRLVHVLALSVPPSKGAPAIRDPGQPLALPSPLTDEHGLVDRGPQALPERLWGWMTYFGRISSWGPLAWPDATS